MRIAAIGLLAFHALAVAQPDAASVPKPDVKVGDRWVYARMDYAAGTTRNKYELRVTHVGADAIHAVIQLPNGNENDATWTSQWMPVSTPEDGIYEGKTGLYRFPLVRGARYDWDYDVLRPREGQWRMRHTRKVEILDWENVTVPAGTFRALRIEAPGTFQRVDMPKARGTAKHSCWYVPAVKRWAKCVIEITSPKGQMKFGEELVEYEVR